MPIQRVALICDRSIEMIVAIIGALKAGGAYLPIEPDAPADRVRYVLEDSNAAAVVTHSHYAAQIEHAHVIAVDQLPTSAPRPPRRSEPHHLAYVIYTSGSTGKPKGVLIEHRNVVHLVFAEKEDFGIRASDALILLSSYSFDASIDQIWLSLTSGAKLVLVAKQSLLDPAQLSQLIAKEHITHLDSLPALLGELSPMLPSVRQVVVGGETCPVTVARAWSRTTRFWNEYGPTETTVGSLRHLVDPSIDLGARVPIGRPIGLNRVYVLDWGGRPVPIGVRGELFLGGAGVARGYLNRDELTRERFVTDPFAGGRMYKTGDIVAWLPDGSIEFFGRIDSQVKVRGFRIELGEIEAALEKHAELTGAAASVMNDRLVAHFVAAASRSVAATELRAFLSATLPAYMIPDAFVQLPAFPRNVSGKIDRKALPAPTLDTGDVEAPATQIEREVRAIWGALLALPEDQISVTRSFFELGGHSLLVMKMLARIRDKLGVALAAQQVLARPTIREIADAIAAKPAHGALARSAATDAMPATNVQRRMYVIHQGAPFNTSDNLPLLYKVDGALPASPANAGRAAAPEAMRSWIDAIERACQALVARHEALRTSFFFHEGEIIQKIAAAPKFQLERYEHDGDVSVRRGQVRQAVRARQPAAVSRGRIRARRRGHAPRARHAPHHLGRHLDRRAARRSARARARRDARRTRGALLRLCAVARHRRRQAAPARRSRVLVEAVARRPARARPALRFSPAADAQPSRGRARARAAGRAGRASLAVRARARSHAVCVLRGDLLGVLVVHDRQRRRDLGIPVGGPAASRARERRRHVRQHARVPHEARSGADLRRAPARVDAADRRVVAQRGHAVRGDGRRDARAGAGPQSDLRHDAVVRRQDGRRVSLRRRGAARATAAAPLRAHRPRGDRARAIARRLLAAPRILR